MTQCYNYVYLTIKLVIDLFRNYHSYHRSIMDDDKDNDNTTHHHSVTTDGKFF